MTKLKCTTHRPQPRLLLYAFTSQIELALFCCPSDVFCVVKSGYSDVRKSPVEIFSSSFLRESIYSWPISKRHGDTLSCLHTGGKAVSVVPYHNQSGHKHLWSSARLQVFLLHCFFFLFSFSVKFHVVQCNMKDEIIISLESGWLCSSIYITISIPHNGHNAVSFHVQMFCIFKKKLSHFSFILVVYSNAWSFSNPERLFQLHTKTSVGSETT